MVQGMGGGINWEGISWTTRSETGAPLSLRESLVKREKSSHLFISLHMAMEDHHHHHHYGMAVADLRQFMNTRPHFPPIPPHHHSPDHLFPPAPPHRTHHPQPQPYDLMMVGRQVTHDIISGAGAPLHDFVVTTDHSAPPTSSAAATNSCLLPPSSNATAALSTFDSDPACLGGGGGDASTGRWPRQETLTLLEIRSRLDSKFKEANQKGPLWDEVSRIMSEEHGYQRSGKKCREKFENLYKYYKKTKEGKAGRQDGKHYRFFRQLEALYGDANNNGVSLPADNHLAAGSSLTFHTPTNLNLPSQHNAEIFQTPKLCDSLSLSNSSDFDTSSSEDDDHHQNNTGLAENGGSTDKKNKRGRRSWKVKIKDFIDSQMRKLMEKQEAWLEKMLKALEHKEQERVLREDEWRKQEAARLDREHKFWATQRAWIEARDAALMDTLQKLTGRELKVPFPVEDLLMPAQLRERQNENGSETMSVKEDGGWPECEISRLMQLRSSMESRFQQGGSPEEVLWEDIAGKMACLGYDRSAVMCKDKWNSISDYLLKNSKECCNKKRKENSRSYGYFLSNEGLYGQGGGAYCEISEPGPEMARLQPNEGSPPSNSNAGSAMPPDSCFRFLMTDGNLWENYALKLNKADNQ